MFGHHNTSHRIGKFRRLIQFRRATVSGRPGTGHAPARARTLIRLFLFHRVERPAVTRTDRWRRAGRVAVPVAAVLLWVATPGVASADTGGPALLAVNDLPTVIGNTQRWILGLLLAVATLFAVLAGVYWATAGGDPAQVDKAKGALRNALVGYGLALLAPVLLSVVKGIVGG